MTIDEAIKGLEDEVKEAEDEGALRAVSYLKLGIEALKRCQHNHLHPAQADFRILPSETEEVK